MDQADEPALALPHFPDWKPRKLALSANPQDLRNFGLSRRSDRARERRHHLADREGLEIEHAINHRAFFRRERLG